LRAAGYGHSWAGFPLKRLIPLSRLGPAKSETKPQARTLKLAKQIQMTVGVAAERFLTVIAVPPKRS